MKIKLAKKLVDLIPETPNERMQLQALWRTLINCSGTTRNLVPIGEFAPGKGGAQFVIEGDGADNLPEFPEVRVEEDCTVYCPICNRFQQLKRGDCIPPCCGRLMDFMD